MAQLEDKTKKAVIKTIFDLWPDAFHLMVVPGGFGKNGIPDHLACVPVEITAEMVGKTYGMFLAVEAKTPVGSFKKIQAVRISEIIKAKGAGYIIYSPEEGKSLKQKLKDLFCLK